MEKSSSRFVIICSIGLVLCLVAFSACVAAEFKRTKVDDVKLDRKLCYLPGSPAYGLGITASICLSIVQIIGTYAIVKRFCSGEKKTVVEQSGKQSIAISLLVLSWIIFGFAIILLVATSSMNKRQGYGDGWLDGDCYVVKDGVYLGTAVLVLATIVLLAGSMFLTGMCNWRKQVEQGRKIHAQVVV
ncbi:Protein of unknown function DUF1218 [Macleaya cordata]|uniref:Uncharacterized protein n=1 Tax=Macleaya cordata TaxID=56857 RepID=A0A200QNL7_MACCD|nr:Protein of unknown function DUF1218 [Macleaya cordata]